MARDSVQRGAWADYAALVRSNRPFRYLWGASVVSLFGDWFNTLATFALVERLSDTHLALGIVFIVKMLSMALASPIAGVIADRYDRRSLLIGADILRFFVVLGFLFIDEPSEIGWLYVLIAAQMAIGSVFRPAKTALLPHIVPRDDLLTANALMAATWSTLLAFGAALGGIATDLLGVEAVYVIDALTYLISGFLVLQVPAPGRPGLASKTGTLMAAAWGSILEGARYLAAKKEVGRIAIVKACWATGGGAFLYLLTQVGEEVSPAAPATGIGLVYAARGIGTGIGPILARSRVADSSLWPRLMGILLLVGGSLYVGLAALPWGIATAVLIVCAHATSGANWVLSTVLLQQRAEDEMAGRVFAAEWIFLTLTDTVSILAVSTLLEAEWLTLRQAIAVFACLPIAAGLGWLLLAVPAESRAYARTRLG